MIDRFEDSEIICLSKYFEGYKDADEDFISLKFDKLHNTAELWICIMDFQMKATKSAKSAEEGIKAFWSELGSHEDEFLKALKG